VLDGKYEITSQRELSARETLFGATAPDGTALQISWYDLQGAEDERAFERYRALLRELRRAGYAAIYDLVARPGAHYVAWRVPDDGAVPVTGDRGDLEPIVEVLAAHGRTLGEARVCARLEGPPQVYALAFGAEPGPAGAVTAAAPSAPPPKAVKGLWTVWRRVRPWALGSVLALTGVLLLLLSAARQVPNRLVSVPDVRGQNVNAALQTLYEAGFSTVPVALISARPAGEVLEVSPEVGTPLRPGRTLSVRYALPAGRAPERVPAVTGVPLARAEAVLGEAGLAVGDVARSYSGAEAGTVIGQTPAAQTFAARGGRVGLLVSDGPHGALTLLPDLTSLAVEDALRLAEAAGFTRDTVRLERTPGNGVAAETVLAQNIPPFVSVPEGRAQLRLTVAERSTPLERGSGTPDLIGLRLAEAQRRARGAGLSVVTEARVSTPELPGGVVVQRPAPGAPLAGSVLVTLNTVAPAAPPRPQVRAPDTDALTIPGSLRRTPETSAPQ
jgi:beta-lactam-binding protein with PASTA domain